MAGVFRRPSYSQNVLLLREKTPTAGIPVVPDNPTTDVTRNDQLRATYRRPYRQEAYRARHYKTPTEGIAPPVVITLPPDILPHNTDGGIFTTVNLVPDLRSKTRRPYGIVDVYYLGVKQMTLTILDGSFSEDESRATRWEATVSLTDPTGRLIPSSMNDLLSPKGTELFMYMGFGDDEPEPVGVYVIQSLSIVSSANGGAVATIKAGDSSVRISDALWEFPFSPPITSIDEAIKNIIDDRVPGIRKIFAPEFNYLPPGKIYGLTVSNPWKDVKDLAEATTKDLRFDKTGTLLFLPVVLDYNNPSADYVDGNGTILKCTRTMNESDATKNGVIVSGESPSGGSIRVVVWDVDPNSPTYYLGPYGKHPDKLDNNTITTSNQGVEAGNKRLAENLGIRHKVNMEVIRDPKIEAGKVVRIGHAQTKTDGYFVVASRSMSITKGTMQITCRERILL